MAGTAAGDPFTSTLATGQKAGAAEGVDGAHKRIFKSGELRLVLLNLIAEQPRHGYDLIRAVEEMTGGEYAPTRALSIRR